MYEPVSSKVDFPAVEKRVLALWDAQQTFKASLAQREDAPAYVFYDGPPFATGLPHYGHLLAGTIKDIVPRYHTMRNHYVARRFGWDCHGLPIEYEVEQDLDINGKSDIERMGVDVFNEKCRGIVLRYTREWRDVVTRMGRWVDFDNEYRTMDPNYMESIWWVFKSLWDKGLVYEGRKVLPYCPRCATPLSNFETNQGYLDVTDPAITVRFRLLDEENAYVLAWTTTPWTLPSNMALAVGADLPYARVQDKGVVYYLARDLVGRYYKTEADYDAIGEIAGRELVGRRYEPLFPYFAEKAAEGAFRIIAAAFVSTEDGTGVVHVAPGFGEDDAAAGLANGIPAVTPIDAECRFTAEVPDYAGRLVKETDADIMARLKAEHKLVHRGSILHSYPHCWRCDSPLIYRGISTWFVRVEALKDRLLAANREIHWVPGHLRDGRFGKWLEGARDWAISRNRYWGTPLPVWRSEDGAETLCVGSIEELERLTGKTVTDLHKHHVDRLTIPSQAGRGVLRRIPEVLDCWFESGAMPYAQAHYPFENKAAFEANFPADFIAEGLDQTRGWFYTLTVLAVALFDRPAFRHVVVNGMILAEDGKKMSKRLKNYPAPSYIIDTYGADALRLYMVYSPVVRAEDLRFSEKGVQHIMRHLLIPLWNAYSFFVTYANVDGWTTEQMTGVVSTNVLDRWIRSSLESLADEVTQAMDQYDLQRAVRPFVRFMEDLTNWYIRRSRRRFWKSQNDDDKQQAYATLNYVLLQFSKVAAPFVPFMADSIYHNLRTDAMPESVHLCDFPTADSSQRNLELESDMAVVMTIVRMGRLLRTENDLKVRQPLQRLHIVSRDGELLRRLQAYEDIVRDELNVKELVFDDNEAELADLKAKADFRRLGPRFGARMKAVAQGIAKISHAELVEFAGGGELALTVDGATVALTEADVVIERTPRAGLVVASEGNVIVALETELSPALVSEGLAREFVSRVQNMRKTSDLEVTQRIAVRFAGAASVAEAVAAHADYVQGEILAESCVPDDACDGDEVDLNGSPCRIAVRVVN
jgi:isoleucyl-tRNA synthetase